MLTNTMIMSLNEGPEGSENYDYILEVSKHDQKIIEDLKSIGWEQFNEEIYREESSRIFNDLTDTVWLGIKRKF